MAEHPKSKSTGGFHHSSVSPCRHLVQFLILPLELSMAFGLPEEELYAEPDDDDDLEVEEGVLDLVLELVVLDGGEHAQAQAQEDDHKAERVRKITWVIIWHC